MADSLYRQKSVDDYLKMLASDAPVPGGGAAAALTAAQGVGLISMVVNLTIGNDKFEAFEELNKFVLGKLPELLEKLTEGIDKDAVCYGRVSSAYALPKGSDAYTKERDRAISEACIAAAEAPLEVMQNALNGLELAKMLVGKSNPRLESDLRAGADLLHASIRASAYMVEVNLPGIRKTYPDIAYQMEGRSAVIRERALSVIKEI